MAAAPEAARRALRALLSDPATYSRHCLPTPFREYQSEVAREIAAAVAQGGGITFTVLFPRQAGKNELSAQLEAWLLLRYSGRGGSLVKAAPSFKPQIINSMLRLERMLTASELTRARWYRRMGYIYGCGASSIFFFSAQPGANIVGATANVLLEGDEAQDLDPEKWDKDLVPMTATGNATRVLYGTPWTDDTLLAREIEHARTLERRDGRRRHFEVGWERVAAVNPAYGALVAGEIARLGESHPIVRTQYLLRAIGRAGRLLDGAQLALLQGEHAMVDHPARRPGEWGRGAFVAGLDVAGADEEDPEGMLTRVNQARDSTVLTIAYAEDELVEGVGAVVEPRLHLCQVYAWRGAPHRKLYPVVLSLVRELWKCRAVAVDATGVGGGLAAFLGAALGPRVVLPFVYTAASKSKLGYDLLGAINGGRLRVFADPTEDTDAAVAQQLLRRELLEQAAAATYELRTGQVMRWSVPEASGHDDLLNALALVVQGGPYGAHRVAAGRRAR